MNILAVGSHPDDIEFACAGTLEKYHRAGHRIFVALTTSGNQGSNILTGRDKIAKVREEEQLEAAKLYGAQVRFLRFDDQLLMDTPELRRAILDAMRWANADVILTHYPGDRSTDHNVTAEVVGRLMLSLPGKNIPSDEPPITKVPSLFHWDTGAGLHFEPEAYVDISETMETKLAALALHKSQFAWMDTFQSVSLTEHCRILGAFRGLAIGRMFAEGFRAFRVHGYMANFRLLP
ncbi:MAG TPA: PIG-L deacetylase family protein [Spirochaetia bacterium]|nr:PIG-L deacetylase family protein [Spirochaetia bacterium]